MRTLFKIDKQKLKRIIRPRCKNNGVIVMNFYPQIARESYDAHGNYVPAWRKYARLHPGVKISNTCDISNFGPYSPAYPTTNEDWRFAMQELQPANKSILTVAGSGDQAIAFAISGAKDIDTFDKTVFANVIMRMKFSAIPTLDYTQYKDFVNGIANAKSVHDIPSYDKIAPKCPRNIITTTKQMNGCKIFHNGCGVRHEYMPTESEYNIAQQVIGTKTFKFIWADLQDLHNYLNKSYDIIYLSNIFEYFFQSEEITKVLNNMKPFLNINGQIMLYTSWMLADIAETIEHAAQECGWGTVTSHEIKNAAMLTLTRVR